jgi:hypothetical protein
MPTILLKKSDTPGSVPGTANLTNLAGGVEVAVNTADKRVYSMTSASAVIELGTNPSSLTCADVSATVLRAGSATITNLIATSASITTLTNNPTFSGGTANGVLYLNGSKVATSGSAFVFDGTNVGIGTSSPGYKLDVVGAINASAASPTGFNHALRTTGVTTGRSQIYLNNTSGDLVLGIEGSTAGASYAGTAAYSAFAATTGANPFYVITNSAIRATFDSSGNLGIGTSSPGAKLEIRDTNATAIFSNSATRYGFVQWENTGGELRIGTDGVFGLRFDTNAQRRMTLDSSGNLGLGVTPSTSWFASSKAIQIGSAGAPYMGLVQQTTTTCDGYMLWGARLSGDRVFQYVTTGDAVAAYRQNAGTHAWFNAASGTAGNTISSFTQAMTLDASGNLLVGTTSAPNGGSVRDVVLHNTNSATTYLKISNASTGATASDGFDLIMGTSSDAYAYNRENGPLIFGTNNTERARITSGGYSKFSNNGTYRGAGSSYHEFVSNADNNSVLVLRNAGANATQYGMAIETANDQNDATRYFLSCLGSTTERATIRSDGGLANYSANNVNLASDERLKKDIAPLSSVWGKVKGIEVVNYRYKDCNEGDPLLYGVIAQQVQPIVPDLVVVTREATETEPEYYGIREQPMYWLAIKALQEAMTRIEQLEAKVAALESK